MTARHRAGHRVAWAASAWLGGLATAAVVGRLVIGGQARAARRAIGKPLGEEAHMADRVYKKKYGDTVDLLLLGDSIAAGLGAELPKHTLGAQLARRVAKRTRRAVRLHTAARVGSEASMLRAQLASLPRGYAPDVAVVVVGGNDVTHRVRTSESTRHLAEAVTALRGIGAEVVVGTCPDLGALTPVPQPLRSLGGLASRQLAEAQREVVIGLGGRAVSLAAVVGPFFLAQPDVMFALDRFHPSSAGYRRTAKAILPSVLAALGQEEALPFGHHPPAGDPGDQVACRI
ncbi:MAG: SGNH/GDSL hydrolase family protein [Nocardioidaceae bacterium]